MWTRINGQRLKFYRALHNMTQDELARLIQITKQHLGEIERGVAKPSLDLLSNACNALEIDPINLFLTHDDPDSEHSSVDGATPRRSRLVVGGATWIIDLADGRLVWSRALYRLLRLAPSRKPSLKLFLKRLREQDAPVFAAFHEQLARGVSPAPVTCSLALADGTYRTLHVQADVLPGGADAEKGQACALFMDVTEGMAYHRHCLERQDELQGIVEDKNSALAVAVGQAEQELRLRGAAERELRAKNAQLERLLTAVPAIIYSFAPGEGGMEWHSRHLQQILGYSLRELQADPMLWNISIHSDDRPAVQKAIARAETGQPLDVEYRIRTKSGTWRRLHDKAVPISDPKGRTILSGVAVDVTAHRLAEEALARNRNMLAQAEVLAGVCSLEWDAGTDVWTLSDNWRRITGQDTLHMYSRELFALVHPDDVRRVMRAVVRTMRTGRPCSVQHRIIRGDTETVLHVHTYGLAEFSLSGQVFRIYGTMVDVTARQLAEQALRESEGRFRTLLQSMPSIAIQGYGPNGETRYWNKASERLYGYSEQEALGRNLLDLIIPPEMKNFVREAIARMIETGQGIPAEEVWLMRKDGSRVPVHSSHVIVPVYGGDPVLYCIDFDLTEQKQAEANLRKVSDLLQAISHMVRIGGWGKNLVTGEDEWSEVTREIHEVGPDFVPDMHNSLAFYKEGPSRDALIEAVTRLIETGEPYDVEVEFITAKGNELWVRTMGQAEFQDGRCVRIFGTFQDITEQKRLVAFST